MGGRGAYGLVGDQRRHLARSRFVVSPLDETLACLKMLHAEWPGIPVSGPGWPPTGPPICAVWRPTR